VSKSDKLNLLIYKAVLMHISSLVRSKLFYEFCTILYPRPPPLQNQPSMAVCNSIGIHAACGCTAYSVPRTTTLLPKVVICMSTALYTHLLFLADFDTSLCHNQYYDKEN
jgi:hypothetical protein